MESKRATEADSVIDFNFPFDDYTGNRRKEDSRAHPKGVKHETIPFK